MLEKVLMVPYIIEGGSILFFVGKRAGADIWQFPTGHVGDNVKGEKNIEAVKREFSEELGIKNYRNFINTKTFFRWKGKERVKESIFAFDITGEKIGIEKAEFSNFKLVEIEKAKQILKYESHKKIADRIYKRIKNNDFAKIFIICGPGGSGKEVVLEGLTAQTPLKRARTITTRARRPQENNKGRKFVSLKNFNDLFRKGELVEKNYLGGNWYGSIRKDIDKEIENGRSVLIELDLNGVKTFKNKYSNVIAIFLTVDIKKLVERMKRRGGEDAKRIKERVRITRAELKESTICDYRVENKEGKLDETIKKITNIIKKERGA